MKITQATQAGSASQIMQNDSKARTRRASRGCGGGAPAMVNYAKTTI